MVGLPAPPKVPDRSPPAAVAGEVETIVPGRDGGPSIEARIHAPAGAVRAVLLCHPHPLYGGSMHSPVPLAIARRLAEVPGGTLAWARFNFRGVGSSGGTYDEGRGELDDARAVLSRLRAMAPSAAVTVCGHSFGSWVGWRAGAIEAGAVDRVLLIAPSTRFFSFDVPEGSSSLHKAIFVGDRDELCSVEDARSLGERIGADVRVFEGYDHHFLKSRRALSEAALPVIAPEV